MKTYIINGISSKDWNRNMIVRFNGHATTLANFFAYFGTKGLDRLFKYVARANGDNCKVRISGVTVYVHFK